MRLNHPTTYLTPTFPIPNNASIPKTQKPRNALEKSSVIRVSIIKRFDGG